MNVLTMHFCNYTMREGNARKSTCLMLEMKPAAPDRLLRARRCAKIGVIAGQETARYNYRPLSVIGRGAK